MTAKLRRSEGGAVARQLVVGGVIEAVRASLVRTVGGRVGDGEHLVAAYRTRGLVRDLGGQ